MGWGEISTGRAPATGLECSAPSVRFVDPSSVLSAFSPGEDRGDVGFLFELDCYVPALRSRSFTAQSRAATVTPNIHSER